MSRLPTVSGQQAVKALCRFGFQAKRRKGSHVVLQKNQIFLTVPLHPALKKGTLNAIIKQAGLTRKEFFDNL
jgi:predicted RNA binding protein YcfA (HicA-like mRNA interferase family)